MHLVIIILEFITAEGVCVIVYKCYGLIISIGPYRADFRKLLYSNFLPKLARTSSLKSCNGPAKMTNLDNL